MTKDNHKVSDEFEFQPDPNMDWTVELAALERLKIIPIDLQERKAVNTLAPSFLIGSYSFLQESRTFIKSWMGFDFNEI